MHEPTIKVRHAGQPDDSDARTQSPASNQRHATGRAGDENYARDSFTLRRMKPWQIAALAIAAAVLVVIALLYV